MLQKYITYLIFVLFPVGLFAQSTNDTLLLEYQRILLKENFLKHNLSSMPNFGEVSLRFLSKSGERRLAQEAHSRDAVEFYALGANQLGSFRVSGDFLFDKVYDDSLAYGQRNDIDRWSTFNYYASKAGKYERQNYKANLTLSYDWKYGIQPFFNVNYLHHWTTGSVDPRFESKKFEMKYNPGVIVHMDDTKLGLKAILGNGRENLDISYKNSDYSSSLLYPDRIHYLNMGYGFNTLKDTSNMRKYSSIYGAEMSLHTRLGNAIVDISTSLERKKENNSNDIKSTKVYNTRSKYIEDKFNLNTFIQLPKQFSHQLINFQADYVNGYDGHVEFSPDLSLSNYEVEYFEIKGGYLFTSLQPKSWNLEAGINMDFFSISRKDYANSIDVSNRGIRISPTFRTRYAIDDVDNIQFGFTPAFSKSLKNSIQYSSNSLNNYIENVVFWDYDYYRSDALRLNWKAEWMTKRISSQYWTGIKLDYYYHKNLGDIKGESALSRFNSKSSLHNFSIGVYLNL